MDLGLRTLTIEGKYSKISPKDILLKLKNLNKFFLPFGILCVPFHPFLIFKVFSLRPTIP
jgi:hypothetical protein